MSDAGLTEGGRTATGAGKAQADLVPAIIGAPDADAAVALVSASPDQPLDEDLLERLAAAAQKLLAEGDRARARVALQAGARLAEPAGHAVIAVRYFHQLAALEESAGDSSEHLRALSSEYRLTEDLQRRGDRSILTFWLSSALQLGNIARSGGDSAGARGLLAAVRARCHELGFAGGECWTAYSLAAAAIEDGDVPSARAYASDFVDQVGPARADGAATGLEPPPDDALQGILLAIARALYYDSADYDGSRWAAEQAGAIGPPNPAALALLALSQMRLERFEEAVRAWDELIGLDPKDHSARANRATSKAMLQRYSEAVDDMSDAIAGAPENPRYLVQRAGFLRAAERDEAALADYRATVELAAAAAAATPQAERAAESEVEYQRNTPMRDLADFGRVGAFDCLRSLGRTEEAFEAATEMSQSDEALMRGEGFARLAALLEDSGKADEALALHDRAIAEMPEMEEFRMGKADACLHFDRLEQAVEELGWLARSNLAPADTAERLDQVLAHQPGNALASKWRGVARLGAIRPSEAVEDLTAAIAALPDDAGARYWRGVAHITDADGDPDGTLTFARLVSALEDLGDAIRLDPGLEIAVESYRWLVDRVTAETDLIHWLLAEADEPNGIANVMPAVRGAFVDYLRAIDIGHQRRWREAVALYETVQKSLLEAGFRVFATRIHADIADNCLRLYELQLALDHLESADRATALHFRPRSPSLVPATAELEARTDKAGRQVIAMELEHRSVYGVGIGTFYTKVKLFRAQALARMGNRDAALAVLEDPVEFARDIRTDLPSSYVRAVMSIVAILRDADRLEEGRAILADLPTPPSGQDQLEQLTMIGSMAMRAGDLKSALATLKRARALAVKLGNGDAYRLDFNIASTLLQLGRADEALLAIKRAIRSGGAKLSDRDRFLGHCNKAQALLALVRDKDALAEILRALEVAEDWRDEFRRFDARMSWQAEQEWLYSSAVGAAIRLHRWQPALDLIERSRSRAFLDELATGRVPLPPSAQPLANVEATLTHQRSLLVRLLDGFAEVGPEYVDVEAVRALRATDPDLDLFGSDPGGPRAIEESSVTATLSIVERRLADIRDDLQDARFANHPAKNAPPLTAVQLRELVSS